MEGKDKFTFFSEESIATVDDFWRFHYSNPWTQMSEISEFIVNLALGLKKPYNKEYWALCDIVYNGLKIEVKESSYCHSWSEKANTTSSRVFGITKAYSRYKDTSSTYKRQNDVYVFCLNSSQDKRYSSPLDLGCWRFYIFKTSVINEICGDNKSISLNKIDKLCKAGYGQYCMFDGIRKTIDELFTLSEWKSFAERDFIERSKLSQNLSKEEWNSYAPTVEQTILSQCPDFRMLKWIKPQRNSSDSDVLEFVFRSITDSNIDPEDYHGLSLEIKNGQGNFKYKNSTLGYFGGNSKCVYGLSIKDAAGLFFDMLPYIFALKNDDFYREIKPCRNASCLRCRHVDYDKRKNELKCPSFYEIPQEIISGEDSHYHARKEQTYDCTFETEIPTPHGYPAYPCTTSEKDDICCRKCKHYEEESDCCPAFPEGIPYFVKIHGHKQVLPGQNLSQIYFEKRNRNVKKA